MSADAPAPNILQHRRLATVLAMAVAMTPLALDAYLPAFPPIAAAFGVSTSDVGLTLSIYVFVLALGQLIGGPLSDRLGRRPILFAGLAVFVTGSLLVAAADSLGDMLAFRAVQAFGGGWVAVSVPAIVRDHTSGTETARLFSLIALIMFLAPALAPTLGSLVLIVSGWPTIFLALAIYAMLTGALLETRLFRHLPRRAPRPWQPLHALVTNYRHVLGHGSAMLLILLQALIFGILMVYLTHAPLLLKDWLGLDNAGFSAVFAATVTAMASVALLNRRLLARWLPGQILRVSVRAQTLAVLALVAVVTLPLPRWLAIPAIMCVIGAQGAIAPNIQAGVMQYFRELGGTAAALMGAVQFAGGGVLSGVVALLARGEMALVTAAMLACSVAATLLMMPIARRLEITPAPP